MRRSRVWASAGLALAFAALTALVRTGRLTWLDQWAVDHLMVGVRAEPPRPLLQELIPFSHDRGPLDAVADAVLLAGHPFVSAAAALWLARTVSQRRISILVGFALAVAIEVGLKLLVERPALHLGTYHLEDFDQSFPSGHATRTVFLAVVAAGAFPGAARWIWLLLGTILVLLVVTASHTPSDVAGGVLLGAALALVVNPPSAAARRTR